MAFEEHVAGFLARQLQREGQAVLPGLGRLELRSRTVALHVSPSFNELLSNRGVVSLKCIDPLEVAQFVTAEEATGHVTPEAITFFAELLDQLLETGRGYISGAGWLSVVNEKTGGIADFGPGTKCLRFQALREFQYRASAAASSPPVVPDLSQTVFDSIRDRLPKTSFLGAPEAKAWLRMVGLTTQSKPMTTPNRCTRCENARHRVTSGLVDAVLRIGTPDGDVAFPGLLPEHDIEWMHLQDGMFRHLLNYVHRSQVTPVVVEEDSRRLWCLALGKSASLEVRLIGLNERVAYPVESWTTALAAKIFVRSATRASQVTAKQYEQLRAHVARLGRGAQEAWEIPA